MSTTEARATRSLPENLHEGLNPEQTQAVLHTEGPLLILAGAGSGKTTVLVSRTGRLIHDEGIPSEKICVLTFTNKAARELKSRVVQRIGPAAQRVWTGTFHSFGLQILKKYHRAVGLPANFGILDQTDSHVVLRDLLKETKIIGKDNFDLDLLLSLIQKKRVEDKSRDHFTDEYAEMAEALYRRYEKRLQLLSVVDFESLLLKPLEIFDNHPDLAEKIRAQFIHLMVDEFQDTNLVQMKLIDRLVQGHRNICVVGDDDQSIYGWRGAEVSHILQFPQRYKPCQVIKLERNYRSQPAIIDFANEVISKNRSRHGKVLKPEKVLSPELPEVFVFESEEEEGEFACREILEKLRTGVAAKGIAVLYRSNSQGALLEAHLRRSQIPYTISGGSSIFDRKESKDLMGFLKQSLSPNDVSLKRIINVPARGIGEASLEKIDEFSKLHKMSFLKACQNWQEAGVKESIGEKLIEWLRYLDTWAERLLVLEGSETPGSKFLEGLKEIGYWAEVYESTRSPGGGEKRWAICEIFARILDGFLQKRGFSMGALRDFVETMTLRLEEDEEERAQSVQLMTLHASKGLEFPHVILMGLEEDLLPHKTLGQDIDEERRLFYVGITRAQDKLTITRCRTRRKHGQTKASSPSRFLVEVRPDLYREFPQGQRPVSGAQRDQMVADFLAKLGSRA